ncbi:MAG: hypothetical protein SFW07_07950, partial [Gammaproteobacteria bacterium]|nr:hypothetical protein [Gammaproteobacteria bacterium]
EKDAELVDGILVSDNVDAQQRANALALASKCVEKAKHCARHGLWTPEYTDQNKKDLNSIVQSLAKTFIQNAEQKLEAPKMPQ